MAGSESSRPFTYVFNHRLLAAAAEAVNEDAEGEPLGGIFIDRNRPLPRAIGASSTMMTISSLWTTQPVKKFNLGKMAYDHTCLTLNKEIRKYLRRAGGVVKIEVLEDEVLWFFNVKGRNDRISVSACKEGTFPAYQQTIREQLEKVKDYLESKVPSSPIGVFGRYHLDSISNTMNRLSGNLDGYAVVYGGGIPATSFVIRYVIDGAKSPHTFSILMGLGSEGEIQTPNIRDLVPFFMLKESVLDDA